MSRDDATLIDMVNAARLILEFTDGFDESRFLKDRKTQSAVLHQCMVLGEAARRVSDLTREQYSAIPWRLIAGMRDRLIHGYDAVDLERVWHTVTHDIPWLIERLEPFTPPLSEPEKS